MSSHFLFSFRQTLRSKMKFFFSIILLLICQYFLNQIIVDARPAKVKKFSWAFPIHNEHEDDTIQELVKRKGIGKFIFVTKVKSFLCFFFLLLLS